MIRCIAVDDEAYALTILADYISKVSFLHLVGTTTNPVEALTWVQEGKVDVVLLDIQMPELTGLQFLKLCGSRCKVILTTAYPEYALEGFEHDVVDYLLKPIAFERFLKAAHKAFQLLRPGPQALPQPAVALPELPNAVPVASASYLFVKGESKNKFIRIDYADILYVEGLKNYVSIYTLQGRVVTYQTLRDLEQELPAPPFLRVHKSYIVSLEKIQMLNGNLLHLGSKQIPVGDTYREGVLRLIRKE